MNFHFTEFRRDKSPWMRRQHLWCVIVWISESASDLCWIWPRSWSGRSLFFFHRFSTATSLCTYRICSVPACWLSCVSKRWTGNSAVCYLLEHSPLVLWAIGGLFQPFASVMQGLGKLQVHTIHMFLVYLLTTSGLFGHCMFSTVYASVRAFNLSQLWFNLSQVWDKLPSSYLKHRKPLILR